MNSKFGFVGALAAASLVLSACGGPAGGGGGEGGSQIDYWLWDANQLPAYQQCADGFNAASDGVQVKITQIGWDDYWSQLTNRMAAGTAPDVITNNVGRYGDFLKNNQLVPLDDIGFDRTLFSEGLVDLWVGPDGKQYGIPKDWDTVALFYNKAMLQEAGLTDEQMANLDWNPVDGGSYEAAIARLSVDKNGVRGDEPGFDKDNVEVYGMGLANSGDGGVGHTSWSFLTATLGWTHTDKNPWGTHFNYDQAAFQDTFTWWRTLIEKGYMPPLETTVGGSMADNFGAGKAAINPNGSWMIGQYTSYDGIEVGFAPTPVGPSGNRASMFNGIADSIWAGSDNIDGAKKWVAYLGSPACQDVVAEHAVVFPAITAAGEKAAEAFAAKGIDVSAFTYHIGAGTTFLWPITENSERVRGIMTPVSDAVLTGAEPASAFTEANEQVNALFG